LLNGNKALLSQVTNFLISTHTVVRKSRKLYNIADSRGKGTVPKYDYDQAEDSYRRFIKWDTMSVLLSAGNSNSRYPVETPDRQKSSNCIRLNTAVLFFLHHFHAFTYNCHKTRQKADPLNWNTSCRGCYFLPHFFMGLWVSRSGRFQ